MFASFGPFFVMPICYHPTTILLVDDDEHFTKLLSYSLADNAPIKTFNHPEDAVDFIKKEQTHTIFTERCLHETGRLLSININALRNEIYNQNRFSEIILTITDYDMPSMNGFDLISQMSFPPEIQFYSYILLTGKAIHDLEKRLNEFSLKDSYIIKSDPNCVVQLSKLIKQKTQSMFQWYSYPCAQNLARDTKENASILFDFHFGLMFNQLIEKNNICELYLYDRQGSFLFLDRYANLSWLFVRNDEGMKNSIEMARRFKAPNYVIEALLSKEKILSLYELQDFENKKAINWDDYLLPITTYSTDARYTDFLNLAPHNKLYYAYTTKFPEHGINKENILSFEAFLKS